MKALVLCGGIPQIAMIKDLRSRGIETILADRNPHVVARQYADKFYQVSTLDVEGIKNLAIKESVDYVLTVCADQVLLVVAQVSEELGLPCYIDYETARNVSSKSFMKRIFVKNGIPTSKHVILESLSQKEIEELTYPLIVKPVDSYSSRGVKKVQNYDELRVAFDVAIDISHTKTAVVEEYFEGNELSVDVYVEDGTAQVLCISALYKIPGNNKFVIHRLVYPAPISDAVYAQVQKTAQDIANAFYLVNSPMLIQLITDGKTISVVEFCARTGGGDKFRLIENAIGFNVVKAVTDLTLGEKPHVDLRKDDNHIVDEFLYCNSGVFDHMEGLEELRTDETINEFFILKTNGSEFDQVNSSGDRVAYFSIQDKDWDRLLMRHRKANTMVKAIDRNGRDILMHNLIENL